MRKAAEIPLPLGLPGNKLLENLIQRLEYQAKIQSLIALPKIITSVRKGAGGFLRHSLQEGERAIIMATTGIDCIN